MTALDELRQLKKQYPARVLVASVMEEYRKEAWVEIIERCPVPTVAADVGGR